MPHEHPVPGAECDFKIDPKTRAVNNMSGKTTLMRYDHNSERYTFEMPKTIDGHDMTKCNKVEVHFINQGSGPDKSTGVYVVNDLLPKESDETTLTFSWLVSQNATSYAGPLSFILRFVCLTGTTVDYAWCTSVHSGLKVQDGIYNSDVIIEDYLDVLEAWKKETMASFKDGTTYIPSVNENGDLSWTNSDFKPNPPTVNIRGPKGDTGPQGPKGDPGSGGGTSNYPDLTNKPSIGGVELNGNKTLEELGISSNAGVHVGNETPADETSAIWLDTDAEPDVEYVNANQGTDNAGKIMSVLDDGTVFPMDIPIDKTAVVSSWEILHEETLTEDKNIAITGFECSEVEAVVISPAVETAKMLYLASNDTGTIYGEPRVRIQGKSTQFIAHLSMRYIDDYTLDLTAKCAPYHGGGENANFWTSVMYKADIPNKFTKLSVVAEGGTLTTGTKVIIRGKSINAPDQMMFLSTDNGDIAYLANAQQLEENPLTATAKMDIRAGTVAVTSEGIVEGEKNFPNYETTEGKTVIMPEEELAVSLAANDTYDYTKFQAIICEYNTSMDDSTSTSKVVIDDNVYQASSDTALSTINKDSESKRVRFGVTNTGTTPLIIRFYTHKEID